MKNFLKIGLLATVAALFTLGFTSCVQTEEDLVYKVGVTHAEGDAITVALEIGILDATFNSYYISELETAPVDGYIVLKSTTRKAGNAAIKSACEKAKTKLKETGFATKLTYSVNSVNYDNTVWQWKINQ